MIFFRYRAHLEAELLRQEQLLKLVIADKERVIQRQDEEIKLLRAKCERLEMLVIPGLRPVATSRKVEPRQVAQEGETSWSAYLKRYMEEQEKTETQAKEQANGVPLEKRASVHQPASGNAQRPNGGDASRDAQSPASVT